MRRRLLLRARRRRPRGGGELYKELIDEVEPFEGARSKTPQRVTSKEPWLRPEATAAVCGDLRLTYRELDRRANALAHRLRELGVGPEVRVGLCAERGLPLLVASSPPPRRAALTCLSIRLSAGAAGPDDGGGPRAPGGGAFRRLLSGARRGPARAGRERRRHGGGGAPSGDGAAARSSGLCHLHLRLDRPSQRRGDCSHGRGAALRGRPGAIRLRTGRRLEPLPLPAFDVSVWEIWGALLHGGRLVVVPRGVTRSPATSTGFWRPRG